MLPCFQRSQTCLWFVFNSDSISQIRFMEKYNSVITEGPRQSPGVAPTDTAGGYITVDKRHKLANLFARSIYCLNNTNQLKPNAGINIVCLFREISLLRYNCDNILVLKQTNGYKYIQASFFGRNQFAKYSKRVVNRQNDLNKHAFLPDTVVHDFLARPLAYSD